MTLIFMLEEIKKARLQKLEAIKSALINPYPEKSRRSHLAGDILKNFGKLEKSNKEIFVCGRIRSLRGHGGIFFADIQDESGKIQVLFAKDRLGNFSFLEKNLDIGDFIEVSGNIFKTKAGEKTIKAREVKFLTKSLLPLPEKWHGLQDVEERFRKRYLDLLMNPEVRQKFEIRFSLIREIRNFLDGQGFLEVETPVLQPIPGGAAARPFKTHLNALDLDLYLRIAPELYLKRLLVGGFEKVYEIGRCFRNEGMDASHNPDFTMLEFYWAYEDYAKLMTFVEEMFSYLIAKVKLQTSKIPNSKFQIPNKFKNLKSKFQIQYQGETLDLKPPYPRLEFTKLLKNWAKVDWEESDFGTLIEAAKKMKLETKDLKTKAEVADEIFKKVVRPEIIQPTFIVNHPLELSPLAKQNEKNPQIVSRFQLIIAGMEIVNAFSELNDPREQAKRFNEQEKARVVGSQEAQRYDADFIEALEYGMPPAAGLGMGIDRLALLFTDSHNVREVILFPTMRPKE
ncbi:MAG: lysine--tRNA ligase [bacterium]|nr:lysine--tRNA ligase [bacterium]